MSLVERIWHTKDKSRPDYGLGFQVKPLEIFQVVPGVYRKCAAANPFYDVGWF